MVAKSCTCLKTVVNIPLFIGFPPYKVVQDFATIAGIHQFHIWNCGNCSYCYWMLMVYGRHMRVSEHGGFPVVTMLVSIQGPWSSMTTGWFGGTPKFREPPYGNIGINQCISCYIMCVHTHTYIYIKKDIYHEDLFSTWTSRMTCNEVPAKIGGFLFSAPPLTSHTSLPRESKPVMNVIGLLVSGIPTPLKKMRSSVGMMTGQYMEKSNSCSKPPTRLVFGNIYRNPPDI